MQIPNGHWPIPESFWPDTSHTTLVVIFENFIIILIVCVLLK